MKMNNYLLWLQVAYSVWQIVRGAKFFRIPSAFVYHTFGWLRGKEVGKPFSVQTFGLIEQGAKWIFPDAGPGERDLLVDGSGCYLQERFGTTYLSDPSAVKNIHLLDRRGVAFLCSSVDLLVPNFFIADVYDWAEGIDMFLKEGRTVTHIRGRVLVMSSREHFLNQNFMRLLSIWPLVLQARRFDSESLYASLGILLLDQLSYPANLLWRKLKGLLIYLVRYLISQIPQFKLRLFVSTFMSTISAELKFSDEIIRNFYFVSKNEKVMLFGSSCVKGYLEEIAALEAPSVVNQYIPLSSHDYESFERVFNGGFQRDFGIQVGTLHLEHYVNGACIKTFLLPENGAYYNFIDYDHLHYGVFSAEREIDVRKALKLLEVHGKMPVTCNHAGQLSAVKFNHFADSYRDGRFGAIIANVQKAS